ncbi:type III secretion system inner rod subunit SctI [Providencia rettgeri]|uniref:Type III secretion system inner rod subunit SctI n=1 Tax=Providencia huashanensis TaxID=3037798 RepID=A0AA42FRV3_9GAMM|nr:MULTISPECIES: type III secretion system inner rod subunit SctI [Providencia]MBC8654878.1 type III secretion system inner rod subunit SctI [Providencia vermicola]EIL1985063.1 type III secretion system inner rod subunit SctI [Providencia rettgeri]EIU7558328.1 type III secretion system inner rod subunit SctI [Providencia rettgeri]EIU9517394.1 type III secretion system inner rod subunit SctI [Providencia rettgeri]EJD6082608.1 type III secretion system inner rod subunit SctI [Providencia rettger
MITPISLSTLPNITDDIKTAVPIGSFEDKVKQLFAEYTAAASNEKANLINQANNTDVSNPAKLLEIQNQVGNYNLAMSMVSTLTHKSVSAIDTVLKAQ